MKSAEQSADFFDKLHASNNWCSMTKKNPSVLWTVDQSPTSIISKDAKKVARKNIGIDIADPSKNGNTLDFLSDINAPDENGNITFNKKTVTVTADTFDNTKSSLTQDKTTPVTAATIKKAIEALDGTTVTADEGEFIDQVSEADGIVSARTKAFDTALSDSSKNAVQNKVVSAALSGHKHTVQFNDETAIDLTCNNSSAISLNHKHGELTSSGTMATASYGVATDGNKKLITTDLSSPSATLDSNTALTFVTGVTANATGKITSITTANVSKSDATNSNVSTTLATSKAVYDVQQNLTTHTHNELKYDGTMTNASWAVVTGTDKKIKTENHNDWWTVPLSGSPDNQATDSSSYVAESGKRALVALHQNSAGKIDIAYYHELSYVDAFTAVTNSLQYTTGTNNSGTTFLTAKDGITINTSKQIYCALTSYTKLGYSSQSTASVSDNTRIYPVSLDKDGKLSVVVPWIETTLSVGTDLKKVGNTIKVDTSGSVGTNATNSVVFGNYTQANGSSSIAGGNLTYVNGDESFGFGYNNNIYANQSIGLGYGNNIYKSSDNSTNNYVIGYLNSVGSGTPVAGTNMYNNYVIGFNNSIELKSGATECNGNILIGTHLHNTSLLGNGSTVILGAYNSEPQRGSAVIVGSPGFHSTEPYNRNIAEFWNDGQLYTLSGFRTSYVYGNSPKTYSSGFFVNHYDGTDSSVPLDLDSGLSASTYQQWGLSIYRDWYNTATKREYRNITIESDRLEMCRYTVESGSQSIVIDTKVTCGYVMTYRLKSSLNATASAGITTDRTSYPFMFHTVKFGTKSVSAYSYLASCSVEWYTYSPLSTATMIRCGGLSFHNALKDSDTSSSVPLNAGGMVGEIIPVVGTGADLYFKKAKNDPVTSYIMEDGDFTLLMTTTAQNGSGDGKVATLKCGSAAWADNCMRWNGFRMAYGSLVAEADVICFI